MMAMMTMTAVATTFAATTMGLSLTDRRLSEFSPFLRSLLLVAAVELGRASDRLTLQLLQLVLFEERFLAVTRVGRCLLSLGGGFKKVVAMVEMTATCGVGGDGRRPTVTTTDAGKGCC